MPKYTKELKEKIIKEYLSGKTGGQEKVANKYNIPRGTLKNWIDKYRSGGFENLEKINYKAKFTSEFKLSVIQYRQINNISYRETAEHFGITNGAVICNWEKTYKEEGLSGLERKIGRPSKEMKNTDNKHTINTPIKESEREELVRLREENRHLKMKIIFEKKLRALLLEQEAEARQRQR